MDLQWTKSFRLTRTILISIAAPAAAWSFASPLQAEERVPIVSIDSVSIAGAAFSGSTGIVRINQAAGIGNLQSNVVIFRIVPVDDRRLDTVTTVQTIAPISKIAHVPSHGTVGVSSDAFARTSGLMQINQSAGNGNTSSNTFTLTLTH